MAKSKGEKHKDGGRKGGVFYNILAILISLGLIVVLQVGFIFFLFALLPSLVAFMIDDGPSKHIYKTVFACNLAGMLPTLATLVQGRAGVAQLQSTMADPAVWVIAYGAAAGGWVLVWGCRAVAMMLVGVACENRIGAIEKAKRRMVEEWGAQIKRLDQ